MKNPTKRIQLDLHDSAYERLNAIKDRTEATSNSEVLRHALSLYATLLAEVDVGNKVVVVSKDGGTRDLMFI